MAGEWGASEVSEWARECGLGERVRDSLSGLDGPALLAISEDDLRHEPFSACDFASRKRLLVRLRALQMAERATMRRLGLDREREPECACTRHRHNHHHHHLHHPHDDRERDGAQQDPDVELKARLDGTASRLEPEVWKAFLSLCYVFLVTWVTAVVMVIVHDKVPDMKKYPPLPDLFLDNVPHIPWAFDMCEITGSILMAIWMIVLLFHKHRFILLRRFFALSGTVFLLRCITMLITSLSVPGSHLKCAPRSYPSDAELYSNWSRRFSQAYTIWTGAGMSVRGVRTCGDYMFSGHTVALTLLNFFITEYTSRSLYLLHIATWLMNMFGIFFILAAHEHYSIDVFIAFYITSRLFLYYHTLSNNQALMQGDSLRTRIWFPLLSFFESEVDGIVPNEYEHPIMIIYATKAWIQRMCRDLGNTSFARFAGNSLSQPATMVDFYVARMLDNFKRNLSIANRTTMEKAQNFGSPSSDKNVQASVSLDGGVSHLHYCTDAMCQRDRVFAVETKCTKKDD